MILQKRHLYEYQYCYGFSFFLSDTEFLSSPDGKTDTIANTPSETDTETNTKTNEIAE